MINVKVVDLTKVMRHGLRHVHGVVKNRGLSTKVNTANGVLAVFTVEVVELLKQIILLHLES